MDGLSLRPAGAADMPAVQAVYAHHVLHGFGTFEETPPPVEEMARRHAAVAGYGLPGHLRITIGLEAHNRALVDALADFLKA